MSRSALIKDSLALSHTPVMRPRRRRTVRVVARTCQGQPCLLPRLKVGSPIPFPLPFSLRLCSHLAHLTYATELNRGMFQDTNKEAKGGRVPFTAHPSLPLTPLSFVYTALVSATRHSVFIPPSVC
jgi:hypothetical protein